MGAVCCCFHDEDFEDYVDRSRSFYRNCTCLSCFVQNLVNLYLSLFRRGEVPSISSSLQGTASHESSLSDMYQSPPRPLPYDADTRYIRLRQDGLFSRHEKGSSHIQEDSEPLRSNIDSDTVCLSAVDKWDGSDCEDESNEHLYKSSFKQSSEKSTGVGQLYTLSEDEDVCPTCLEEYTLENPKIMTKCCHHFHLACIYEWMERSESCPVCGKEMAFEETT